jgi:N-acetyltransferase
MSDPAILSRISALGPVVLEGTFLRLEPLRPVHRDGLLAAAQSPEIWPWMPANLMTTKALDQWITEGIHLESQGSAYPFTVIFRETGRIVGSTRYLEVRAEHQGVEIGWTWYAPDVWGTVVNAEAKLLLLRHAFDDWKAIRVQLKTDHMNVHSRNAILKLGAKFEGTLRQHRVRPDGTTRDTVMFSILGTEWPGVRADLLRRLAEAPRIHDSEEPR